MKKSFTFVGVVGDHRFLDNFDSISLIQDDGYAIDLISRLNETAANYGYKVTIRLWSADKPQTKDELIAGFIKTITGTLDVQYETDTYQYSEYTSGVDYNTIFNVGNHNLYNQLRELRGKYIHLEVEFSK